MVNTPGGFCGCNSVSYNYFCSSVGLKKQTLQAARGNESWLSIVGFILKYLAIFTNRLGVKGIDRCRTKHQQRLGENRARSKGAQNFVYRALPFCMLICVFGLNELNTSQSSGSSSVPRVLTRNLHRRTHLASARFIVYLFRLNCNLYSLSNYSFGTKAAREQKVPTYLTPNYHYYYYYYYY